MTSPLALDLAVAVLRREAKRCFAVSLRHFARAERLEAVGCTEAGATARKDGAIYAEQAARVERQASELEEQARKLGTS